MKRRIINWLILWILNIKIHGVVLILTFVAGSSQEVVDLRVGKVDTICEKIIIEDIIKLKGNKILFETNFKNFWKVRKEKKKHVRYFIRGDGEEKVKGIFRRRYEKVSFVIWEGRSGMSYYRILVVDNRDKKMTEVQKGSRVDICMYCEKKSFDTFYIGFRYKNFVVKLDGGYEIPIYALSTNIRFCYFKDVNDLKILKKQQ